MKATICGAAGGIGQPLSLLLKLSPYIDELALYDVVNAPGVGADLSHICTNAKITSHLPADDGLKNALSGSDVVLIPAGVPRKPGMTRDDLFSINASIVSQLAEGVAVNCPDAFVLVISNPVNSTVPIFAQVLKKYGVLNARKLFGVTTLDTVRSNTFISEVSNNKLTAQDVNIPVIGGHSGSTIVPLFSVGAPDLYSTLKDQTKSALIHRVQYGGDEVVKAKEGKGSATLSMAYAAFRLVNQLLKAVKEGDSDVVETSYIYLDESIPGAKELKSRVNNLNYFAIPVKLGPNGVEEVKYQILDKVNDHEKELLSEAVDQLSSNIEKGTNFVTNAA